MSRKNDLPILVISLLVTLAALGGGAWWLLNQTDLRQLLSTEDSPAPSATSPQQPDTATPGDIDSRLSSGDKILLAEPATTEKQAGVQAIANGDYETAIVELEAALEQNRNDPEALIYLSNARIGNQQAYTIAVAVPAATDVNSAKEILRGVAQAQITVNEDRGINGIPLRIGIASDDNNPAIATEVAEALVQDPEVLGVIGHFGSETTLAASEVYDRGNLVVISPTSTSVRLSEAGNYVFRTVPSDRFTATALSRYMVNTLQQQNAVIYFNADSDYSQSLKQELTTAIYSDGGQVVADFNLADPGFSASTTLEQAIQQGADIVILAPNTATLDQALQVVSVNRRRLEMLGGDSVYNSRTLQVGGEAAEGMVVAVPWVLLSDPTSDFATVSSMLWGGDVNWRTAMAYDATLALVVGLSRNPSREGLQQALAASDFLASGATGAIRFLPSGDRNQAMQLVVVEAGERSGYGYDFVPVE
jgi:branched-chain amino acid transport system substrate-binding protein